MKLITLASLVISLIIINILFRIALSRITKRNLILNYLKRYLPVFELFGWSIFAYWLMDILFSTSQNEAFIHLIILIIVAIFISWFLLRDLFSGVIVKARFNLVKGQKIRYEKLKGEIKRAGLFALSIRDENGIDVIIPYAKLDHKEIRLNYWENGDTESSFTLELNSKFDTQETMRKMEELIINSAWCSTRAKPRIQFIGKHNNKEQFEVTCQTITSDGIRKLKMILSQNLEG